MTNVKFRKICEKAVDTLRELAPKDTGNLAFNGIRVEFPTPDECVIYVDGNTIDKIHYGIAPYMPFTNEPWISPKWNGKKNPNEGWWQDSCEYIIALIAKMLKGELEKNDIDTND